MTEEKKYEIDYVDIAGVSMYHIDLVNGGTGEPSGHLRNVGVTISWTANIGFGEMHILDRGDGKIEIDAEGLGREFVAAVLNKIAETAKIRDDIPRCKTCKKCQTSLRSGGWFCPNCHPGSGEEPLDEDEEALPKLLAAARSMVSYPQERADWDEVDDLVHNLKSALKYYDPWTDDDGNCPSFPKEEKES